jgi:hypothetical protein
MKIAVHQNLMEHGGDYSARWIERLRELGVEHVVADMKKDGALANLADCDGLMWHWFHLPNDKQSVPKILDAVELGLKKKVWPNHATRFHFDEKTAQHYFFQAIGAPYIKSWAFWKKPEAMAFLAQAAYPLVFKLSSGAGSTNVQLIRSRAEGERIASLMFGHGIYASRPKNEPVGDRLRRLLTGNPNVFFQVHKNYAYFQEFLPGNDHDIRITVIGGRAFGFIRYNRDNDFRASGSGKISYDLAKIPLEAVRVAHQISQRQGFQSMAYDFLYDKEGAVAIGEISYGYMDSAVHACPGHWDRDLNWHEGHVWPQDAHVDDFLDYVRTGELV